MQLLLIVLFILALACGIGTCAAAKSAVHEIQGMIWIVVAAVLLCALAVVNTIIGLAKHQNRKTPAERVEPKV